MTNEYCNSTSSSFGHRFLRVEFGFDCDFNLPLFAVGVSQTLKRSLAYLQCEGIWRAKSLALIWGQSKYPRLATSKKSNKAWILRSLSSLVLQCQKHVIHGNGSSFLLLALVVGVGVGVGIQITTLLVLVLSVSSCGSMFVLLGVVGLGFEEGFALVLV